MKMKTLKDIEMIKRKLNILMNYSTYMGVGQAVLTHLRKYNGVNILLKQKKQWVLIFHLPFTITSDSKFQ